MRMHIPAQILKNDANKNRTDKPDFEVCTIVIPFKTVANVLSV